MDDDRGAEPGTAMLRRVLSAPFRRQDLPALRLSRRGLDHLVRDGTVVRPFRGIYLPTHLVDDPIARAQSIALLLPRGAAVCRGTASWLHGLDVRPPGAHRAPPTLECVVPAGTAPPRHTGVAAYSAPLPARDIRDVHGLPVTTLERTALDLARYLPPFMGLAALDQLTRRRLVDPLQLQEQLRRWAGGRYVARARRVLELCDPRAESFGESWLRLRMIDAGFPPPRPQVWVQEGDRLVYRLDLGWDERKIGLEYDGEEFHSDDADVAHDLARRARLMSEFGWHVVGVGRGEVLGRSMALELGVGELLGLSPSISSRRW